MYLFLLLQVLRSGYSWTLGTEAGKAVAKAALVVGEVLAELPLPGKMAGQAVSDSADAGLRLHKVREMLNKDL